MKEFVTILDNHMRPNNQVEIESLEEIVNLWRSKQKADASGIIKLP